MSRKIRGLEARDEIHRSQIQRDIRGPLHRIKDLVFDHQGSLILIMTAGLFPVFKPGCSIPGLLLALAIYLFRVVGSRSERLPIRIPATENRKDRNDPKPGRNDYFKASGIFYMGNEVGTGKELWLSARDMLKHFLLFGQTGAGKTETLVSLASNFLAMGSGLIYTDAKAAVKLEAQIYTLCRIMGRDDDFRLMNFGTSGKKTGRNPDKLSNTNNPFAYGSPEALTQLLVSLMPKTDGPNAIFGQKAQALITGAMYAFCDLRDKKVLELSVETIRETMPLEKMVEMAMDDRLSPKARASIHSTLAGFGWSPKIPLEKQLQQKHLPEQYTYAHSYFSLALASLSDTYGHIYGKSASEIDMVDAILNRRVLSTLIPSLEKSTQEVGNIGRITLSGIRNALTVGLGTKVEGSLEDILGSLPVEARIPMGNMVDEYAAITTEGFAEINTQGRGLGLSNTTASQDYGGMEGKDKTGTEQIAANSEFKAVMHMNDPQSTWRFFRDLAGKALIFRTAGYEVDNGGISQPYEDQLRVTADHEDRISLQDLQEQIEGEFHGFFMGQVIRGQAFHADPPLSKHQQVYIPRLLAVKRPDTRLIRAEVGNLRKLLDTLRDRIQKGMPEGDEEIGISQEVSLQMRFLASCLERKTRLSPMSATIAGFLSWTRMNTDALERAFGGGGGGAERPIEEVKSEVQEPIEPPVQPVIPMTDPADVGEPPAPEIEDLEDFEEIAPPAAVGGDQAAPEEALVDPVEALLASLPREMRGEIAEEAAQAVDAEIASETGISDPATGNPFSAMAEHIDWAGSGERAKSVGADEFMDSGLREDLEEGERRLGASPEEAAKFADETIESIKDQMGYPIEPTPAGGDQSREEIRNVLEDLLGSSF